MKKLIILLLVFVTLIPSCASAIDIRKEGTVHQGGMRTPSLTRVSADYENGIITIGVNGYTGIGVNGYTGGIQVLVSDSQGNVVSSTMSSITNSGVVSLDLGTLAEGGYSLNIILDNATYYGQFDA